MRPLRYKPYSAADEDEWDWVIWGLNRDSRSDWRAAAAKRVSRLLLNMKELDDIRAELRKRLSDARYEGNYCGWPEYDFSNRELVALDRRGRQLTSQINEQLAFYKWSPSIFLRDFEEFHQYPEWNARSEADCEE